MSEVTPETIEEIEKKLGKSRRRLRIALIIGIIAIIIVIIGLVGIQIQRGSEKIAVENTIRDYLEALNSYDVDAAWALMSPRLKEYMGNEAFESLVHDFEQRGWQAEIEEITDRSFLGAEEKRTWKFTLIAETTETEGTHTETWTFLIVNVGPHAFSVEWKIDDWWIES